MGGLRQIVSRHIDRKFHIVKKKGKESPVRYGGSTLSLPPLGAPLSTRGLCGRLGLLLLPHDVGVALLPGLERHPLVALGVLRGLGLARVLFGRLLPRQVALVAPRHDQCQSVSRQGRQR